jgi:hypothetical protein
MSKWKTIPLAVSVFYEGDSPIFAENSYHVSVEDEAGGPFISIKSNGENLEKGQIDLDLEALQLISEEAEKLIKIHEELKDNESGAD